MTTPVAAAAPWPRVDLAAAPGATVAEWTPNVDYYTLDNTMTPAPTGETAHPGLERRPGTMMVRAWGTVGNNGLHATMAIEDPAVYMASALKEALRGRGILVSGTAVSRHKVSNGTGDFAGERAQPLQLTRSDLARVIAPVAASRESPGGNVVAPLSVHVYGVVPPVPATLALYAVPCVPLGSDVVVISSSLTTVSENVPDSVWWPASAKKVV